MQTQTTNTLHTSSRTRPSESTSTKSNTYAKQARANTSIHELPPIQHRTYAHTYTHTQRARACANRHTHLRTSTLDYALTYTSLRARTHRQTQTQRKYARAHTHTHTHTHTHPKNAFARTTVSTHFLNTRVGCASICSLHLRDSGQIHMAFAGEITNV
jgi:hypothetical protein